ncbi:uncharacterized protein ACN427_007067 isoform 1-T1 [Glossina fuscipes fuscipes]
MADKRARKEEFTDLEAVDDMLINVNNFIEGIYRDLNIRSISIPEFNPMSQILNSQSRSTSPSSPLSSPVIALDRDIVTNTSNSLNFRGSHRILEPISHPEVVIDTVRVNRIYGTPDHNQRSIGISIGNCSTIKSVPILPCGPVSQIMSSSINNANLRTNSSCLRNTSACPANAAESIVDLTILQTPESLRYRSAVGEGRGGHRRNNYKDGDVTIVPSCSNEVIDLCTPTVSAPVSKRALRLDQNSSVHNISESPIRPTTSNNQYRRRFSNRPNHSQQLIVNRDTSKPKKATDKSSSNEYSLLSTVLPTTPGARTPFMCPVCMESTVQRQPTSTRCGHVFCQSCIRQAIEFSRKCPLCKAKVLPNHLLRIYL